MRFTDRLQGVLIRKEARVEFTHTEEWVQDLFYILVNLFPWVSLALYNGCHKVSAIYLYPACRSGRTSCSLTTVWSNTISLTSLLQKTWWQRKFLCFNKDQSKEFIEPLDRSAISPCCFDNSEAQSQIYSSSIVSHVIKSRRFPTLIVS